MLKEKVAPACHFLLLSGRRILTNRMPTPGKWELHRSSILFSGMSARSTTGRIIVIIMPVAVIAGRNWLENHPEHNPFAPLDLRDPPGWATQHKLDTVRSDLEECLTVLKRSGISFNRLDPAGDGPCLRSDRVLLKTLALAPGHRPQPAPQVSGWNCGSRKRFSPWPGNCSALGWIG